MIDKDKIKQAFNNFEDDKFTIASDILRGEIKKNMNSFLKDKLELQNDVIDVENED